MSMSDAFKSIEQGLHEAINFAEGKPNWGYRT